LLFSFLAVAHAGFLAGAAKIDCTPSEAVPLAGINHGERRVKDWPIPKPTKYTTWMTPSQGRMPNDGIFCRALTIRDTDTQATVTFVTIDAIGALGHLKRNAVRFAAGLNFTVDMNNVILSGSHSHSGPGAIASDFLWQIAPAIDLEIPIVAEALAMNLATVMAQSEKNLKPALIDADSFMLLGVSKNRRCHISPFVNCSTIDPHMGVMRVDDAASGKLVITKNKNEY
jgi:neutral ceramidase